MKVNIHSVVAWERGHRIVIVSKDNPDAAVVITLENGQDEEAVVARVRNAFATLRAGLAHGVAA